MSMWGSSQPARGRETRSQCPGQAGQRRTEVSGASEGAVGGGSGEESADPETAEEEGVEPGQEDGW